MFHWFSAAPTQPQPISFMEAMLIELAIVLKPIKPHCQGLIEYKGRCWNARCALPVTLADQVQVQVIGDYGDYLLVAPLTE